jgi:hypothetical protein
MKNGLGSTLEREWCERPVRQAGRATLAVRYVLGSELGLAYSASQGLGPREGPQLPIRFEPTSAEQGSPRPYEELRVGPREEVVPVALAHARSRGAALSRARHQRIEIADEPRPSAIPHRLQSDLAQGGGMEVAWCRRGALEPNKNLHRGKDVVPLHQAVAGAGLGGGFSALLRTCLRSENTHSIPESSVSELSPASCTSASCCGQCLLCRL